VILRAAKIAIADEHTMAAELDKPAPANVFFFCHPVLHPDKSFGYLNLSFSLNPKRKFYAFFFIEKKI
jgi:hypothetical protein